MAPLTATRRSWRRWRSLSWQARAQVLWTMFVVMVLFGFGLLGARSYGEADRVHDLIDRDCAFFADLGTVPVPVSSLGRKIVLDARAAYEARCRGFGDLPPVTVAPTPTPRQTR